MNERLVKIKDTRRGPHPSSSSPIPDEGEVEDIDGDEETDESEEEVKRC